MKYFVFGSNNPSLSREIFNRVFLLLFLATVAVVAPCGAQDEKSYGLEICGVKVTDENIYNLSSIEGVSGIVEYEPETKSLGMSNAKIVAKNGQPAILSKEEININLYGGNTITAEDAPCIVLENGGSFYSMMLEDSLKCHASEDYAAVLFAKKFTINGTNLEATGKYGLAGIGDSAALSIVHSDLKVYGKESATYNIASFEKETVKFASPEGSDFDANLRGIAKDGKLVSDTLAILPLKLYEIVLIEDGYGKTNNVEHFVDEENYKDLSVLNFVEGKMDYNPDTKTLTLDNVKINGSIIIYEDSVTILLKGTNEITNTKSLFLYDYGIAYMMVDTASIRGVGGGELKITSPGSAASINIYNISMIDYCRLAIKDCNMEINGKVCIWNLGGGGSSRPKGFYASSFFESYNSVEKKTVRSMEKKGPAITIDNSNMKLNCSAEGTPIAAIGGIELLRCSIISPENVTIGENYFLEAGGNPLSKPVVIESESTPVGIDNVKTDSVSGVSKGVFTIDGIRMNVDEKDLPAGLYIIDGKKIIKK